MRVAIVNDLALAAESLRRVILGSRRHTVAWIANNGAEAVEKCLADRPDCVLMDMIMPVMDGVEATRRIMRVAPCPILVVTASVSGNSSLVFEAMGAGALDAVATPVLAGEDIATAGRDLLRKLDRIERLTGAAPPQPKSRPAVSPAPAQEPAGPLVVIGASTGGPQALRAILAPLPSRFAAAIVVIQHMNAPFLPGLAEWLNGETRLPVRVFQDGDRPQAGHVLIAATAGHARMEPGGRLRYTEEPKEAIYHPCIDVFFLSVAEHWPASGVGVLLTGMGRDGATGLLALRRRGFATIGQDRQSCVVFGMPGHAQAIGAAGLFLPPQAIAQHLVQHYGST